MSTQPGQPYRSLVLRLAQACPTYRVLNEFLSVKTHACQRPAKTTIITINPESADGNISARLEINDLDGSPALAQYLGSPRSNQCCQLFLVENLCPETIALLGGHFDIDPQFFAEHVDNTSWYRITDVADHIPALPSTKKMHDFLQLRHIEARVFSDSPTFQSLFDGSGTTITPDRTTTRLPRKAGRIIPRSRKGLHFDPLICTRRVVTVWFQKRKSENEGWTGRKSLLRSETYHI